ncbi:MAG TPA: hypothetical protein VGZ47_03195 [Gemmataceae bacterium]|jgi:hypothetical protein|nr:hypothetical protein [Gemmataceae bacterium]
MRSFSCAILLFASATVSAAEPKIDLMRVPDQGIQPQLQVDAKGTVHLIYFKGDPGHGDIFYTHLQPGQRPAKPMRVNSHPGSAIAIGNIRGAQLALGKNGRVHVAWNGSSQAEPKGPDGVTPMLYTRLNDAGTAFESQRNLMHSAFILDGGGSVAADQDGNVYVTWHAASPERRGEAYRCVWVARSSDEGKSFGNEKRAIANETGACGCCGMRAFADSHGGVYALYRSAEQKIHRDTWLLFSRDQSATFQGEKLHDWQTDICPMSSMALAETSAGVLAAWESNDQVYFSSINPKTGRNTPPVSPAGQGKRKHPVLAANSRGEMIFVWTERMGWNQGGDVVWQVYDKDGKPTAESGSKRGVPTWSLVAVFADPDGNFIIVY